MTIIGRFFPSIYEKRFYKRLCEILAFLIYALVIMIIFGMLSSNHNNAPSNSGFSKDSNIADKVRQNISNTNNFTIEKSLLSVSEERVTEFKKAVRQRNIQRASEIAQPVVKRAKEMGKVEGVVVK